MRHLYLTLINLIIPNIYFVPQKRVTANRPPVFMKKLIPGIFLLIIFGVVCPVHAIDGFAIWSKGSNCESELQYTYLPGMEPGETRVAVIKGPGADIMPVISYDGIWIAWCRSEKAFSGRYGACDYHNFKIWNLYIAKIDNGKNLPAKPIKIANGYLPQWGDDPNNPHKGKTLYFTEYHTQNIMKTTIRPDGSFINPVAHASSLNKRYGTNASTQCSPNGRYITIDDGRMAIEDLKTNVLINDSITLDGRYPSWGPRSKYIFGAHNSVIRIDNGKLTMKRKNAGLGLYWFGASNDAYYDEGKLWVIGCCNIRIHNRAGDVSFRSVDISGGGYEIDSAIATKIGEGTAADIHVWGSGTGLRAPANQKNGIGLTAQIIKNASGLQLIIKSDVFSSGYNAALYDFLGKRKVFVPYSPFSNTVMPLHGVADGMYILKLGNSKISVQTSVNLFLSYPPFLLD